MSNDFIPETGPPTGGQHPVLKARWLMKAWQRESTTYNQGLESERTSLRIRFKFDELEAIELKDPYPFPTAEIVVPYTAPSASRGGTRWDVWTASGRKIFGKPFSLDDLVGKWQTWAQVDTPIRMGLTEEDGSPQLGPDGRQLWGDVMTPVWQILEVEGIGASGTSAASNSPVFDIMAYMAGVAEGCDENLFHQKLIGDQKITEHEDIVRQITSRSLVGNLISMKKITRDEQGVLHTV